MRVIHCDGSAEAVRELDGALHAVLAGGAAVAPLTTGAAPPPRDPDPGQVVVTNSPGSAVPAGGCWRCQRSTLPDCRCWSGQRGLRGRPARPGVRRVGHHRGGRRSSCSMRYRCAAWANSTAAPSGPCSPCGIAEHS
jgi:hypothetical protein